VSICGAVTVAVVIPLFNHERYIAGALRSLLAQTRAPDRIIVIDDGATDGSLEAARGMGDSRITVVSQANAGAHAALNRGIGLVGDADFIGILNSDDLYEAGRVEACLGVLEKNPGADVVVTRLRIIDENEDLLEGDDARVRWMESVWQARNKSPAAWLGIANFTKTTSNLFGRAEYFRAHPFRPYRYVHDYFFALGAALEDRLILLNEELLRYRVHEANTIKSGPGENLPREVIRMNIDLLRAFAPTLAESPEVRGRMAAYFRTLVFNYGDFRIEPFLCLVAGRFASLSDAETEALCEGLEPGRFPELLEGKSRELREYLARIGCHQLVHEVASSRWLALGRLLGGGPRLIIHAKSEEERLKAMRKACADSAWYRLGEKLGFVYAERPEGGLDGPDRSQ
jgi:glycosyltransferase involved in cell wall biosynthesis